MYSHDDIGISKKILRLFQREPIIDNSLDNGKVLVGK
jgi:hypothetical protein